MISLQNISRIYYKNKKKETPEDVIALYNISLTLPDKGFVTIIGPSGCGKTTLLNILGGIDTPTSGDMIVDNMSTKAFKAGDWDSYRNEKIGFVLQNCYLLSHLTIRENVAIKLQISNRNYQNIDELVDNALRSVDLYERRNEKPKALSGGQKQRVAIARAIVGEPVVLLADEPTGALDSKNGEQIMELLKTLSKDHLVVMVSHNKEYANKYSDRIIELKDGKVVSDSSPINEIAKIEDKKMDKVSFPLLTSLKWGFKNIIVKKYSTISVILATSLGLAGVGLILSTSSVVNNAFKKAEQEALSDYPVSITSYSKQSSEGSVNEYEEFTDEQVIFADISSYLPQEHYNYMSDEFLSYMGNMSKDNYIVCHNASATSFNIFAEVNKDEDKYQKISSNAFYKGVEDVEFIKKQYDCLKGSYPVNENDLVLVVDSYNRISGGALLNLGFDVSVAEVGEDIRISFDNIIGKSYHYITGDQYWEYDSGEEKFKVRDNTAKEFYNASTYSLNIVGILREKEDSDNPLFNSGVMYSPKFAKKVVEDAQTSEILNKQKEYGLTKNVLTGEKFEDKPYSNYILTAQYLYEEQLFVFGGFERVIALYYFTKDYTSRHNIDEYFSKYVPNDSVDFTTLTYYDYLEKVSIQFDGALLMMTSVLYVFAAISVFVSAILNGILTYISVHQRTSEIGLLRSIGARRKDIAIMIETESLITGLIGSLFSILVCVILTKPINIFMTDTIHRYNFYLLGRRIFELEGFQWWVAPIMIGLGLLTALVSALIPSYIASKKDPAHAINE